MNDNEINDKRMQSEFRQITFSNFQKIKVKRELIACLLSSKIEAACYWGAEYICAGHFIDLWECIIEYMSKYIHLGNPKLPIYISMRMENFKNVLSNGYIDNELRMRNNSKIRKLFAEIIGVLCYSKKKHQFEAIKIKKEHEFNMTHMSSRLTAPTIKYAESIFNKGDPKEIYIAINEFAYNISPESKNIISACYWVEWLLEFETLSKKKKESCQCERRSFVPVLDKYQMDPIWMIWELLVHECAKQCNITKNKIMDALLNIFCIKFTSGVKKRRRYLIYFAIAILTEPYDSNITMINKKNIIENIIKKIDVVYKDVKKNEVSPDTDYLFNGTPAAKSNLDKTIERLDALNKISEL
jgi:hypothetical protein